MQVQHNDVTHPQRVYLRDLWKNDFTKGAQLQVGNLIPPNWPFRNPVCVCSLGKTYGQNAIIKV